MSWVKFFTWNLLIASLSLQGCVTTSIILDKARGVIDFAADVDNVHFDSKRNEFVICFSETLNKHNEVLTITISDKIILNVGDNRGSINQVTIKDEGKRHWWDYEERQDLHVFKLKTKVDAGCKPVSTSAVNIPIVRASDKEVEAISLIKLKGNLIQNMLDKKLPFVIFIQRGFIKNSLSNKEFSPCEIKGFRDHSCIMLFIKPQPHKNSQGDEYYELLSIEELTYSKYANTLWYFALPFSVPIDISIYLIALLTLLAMLGGPGMV